MSDCIPYLEFGGPLLDDGAIIPAVLDDKYCNFSQQRSTAPRVEVPFAAETETRVELETECTPSKKRRFDGTSAGANPHVEVMAAVETHVEKEEECTASKKRRFEGTSAAGGNHEVVSTDAKKQRTVKDPSTSSTTVITTKHFEKEEMHMVPTTNDVLFGRGELTNRHVGNKQFHAWKKGLLDEYARAEKKEKAKVAEKLVALVESNGGQFLKEDKEKGQWLVAQPTESRKKASQALREGLNPRKR